MLPFSIRSILFVACSIVCLACLVEEVGGNQTQKKKICGLTLVAPPKPFASDPMQPLLDIHCNWIAVVPYGFTPMGRPEVRYGSNHQWWGESPDGVRKTISLAQQVNLKTMLKPQVWSHGWWTGDYNFETEQDWLKWENDYEAYILFYAELADSLNVDLFCLGTEFKMAVKSRPQFWLDLIVKVRDRYQGPLTYAANWDNFSQIPFWDKLDFIGINAYFPLTDAKDPGLMQLKKAWKKPVREIRACHQKHNKPVIFTEYGYLSVDGPAHNTWELEHNLPDLNENQSAQASAIDALHHVFAREPYWQGGFLWKWYPGMQGHEGHPKKDYTPQGKKAEKILAQWFLAQSN
ncbi:MAG: hypothetical protein HKN76_14750 [Saprospiraceae bacterium]|nr:hypothetical protein [Saprospiraceae bacterium]